MKLSYKLTSVFLAFTLSITILFYWISTRNQEKNFERISRYNIEEARASFYNLAERDTNMLFSTLETVLRDRGFRDVYLQKDRTRLYTYGQSLFHNLRDKYGITHFYFILPDGLVFLRMHNKEIYGDLVERHSFQKARDGASNAWEIELGKTAFALRAVMPYYVDGTLIGYLEMAEEIDHFLHILKKETDGEFGIIVDKTYLDRDDWTSTRRVAGLRDNWDDMEKYLVISNTSTDETFKRCFSGAYAEKVGNGKSVFRKIHDGDRTLLCGGFDLRDSRGRFIGAVLSMGDVSDLVAITQKAKNTMFRVGAIFFLVTFAAGLLISRSITKPIGQLAEASKAIAEGDLSRRLDIHSSDEIGRMTAAFNEMTEKRQAVEDALIESQERVRVLNEHIVTMLMAMTHDIRGPFIAITATLKLLLRGSYGKMDESVANTLKDLMARVAHLQGIAEDCLGKAHVVGGSMKFEKEVLDLREDIIDPILDELSSDIQERDITIDNRMGAIPAGTVPVSANKTWLKVVFRNLFMNAVKYGGNGCTIAFGVVDRESHYRLNVYNSGTPVPEEERERLFKKFERIASEATDAPTGIGLGLYLVRDILRKHGGDIWYEAKHDGSDFIVTIPKDTP